MAETPDWKQIIEKSKRSILVTFRNYTKYTLQRLQYSLDHGKWASIPQETIPPYSEVQFAAVNRGPIHGTSGKVIYCLSKNPHIKFEIVWENTFLDRRNAVCNVYGATERFHVTRTVNRRPHFEAIFEVQPNTVSPSPVHSISHSKSSPLLQVRNQSQSRDSLHYVDSDDEVVPKTTLSMVPHEADDRLWKYEQQESNRSINITIKNNTDFEMKKSNQTLKEGIWSKMPPDLILPMIAVEFGCRSDSFKGGVCGEVAYHVESLNLPIFFHFENPFDGDNSYWVDVTEEKLVVDIAHDEEPNSNVIYTVIPKPFSESSSFPKIGNVKRSQSSVVFSSTKSSHQDNSFENSEEEGNDSEVLPAQLPPRRALASNNALEMNSTNKINNGAQWQNSSSNLRPASNISSRMSEIPSLAKSRVFGVPLRVIVERENTNTRVPLIVERLTDRLLKYGREEPLLFKKPGYSTEITSLRALFDYNSRAPIDFNSFSIHSCAHVLKMFLRELMFPVIPPTFAKQFISCYIQSVSDEFHFFKMLTY